MRKTSTCGHAQPKSSLSFSKHVNTLKFISPKCQYLCIFLYIFIFCCIFCVFLYIFCIFLYINIDWRGSYETISNMRRVWVGSWGPGSRAHSRHPAPNPSPRRTFLPVPDFFYHHACWWKVIESVAGVTSNGLAYAGRKIACSGGSVGGQAEVGRRGRWVGCTEWQFWGWGGVGASGVVVHLSVIPQCHPQPPYQDCSTSHPNLFYPIALVPEPKMPIYVQGLTCAYTCK